MSKSYRSVPTFRYHHSRKWYKTRANRNLRRRTTAALVTENPIIPTRLREVSQRWDWRDYTRAHWECSDWELNPIHTQRYPWHTRFTGECFINEKPWKWGVRYTNPKRGVR